MPKLETVSLTEVFPYEITQVGCQAMNANLVNNRLLVLLMVGLTKATPIANKHGWVTVNGIIKAIGYAGIVYKPGDNYNILVFLHNPQQSIWEPLSELTVKLSQVVDKFYHLP